MRGVRLSVSPCFVLFVCAFCYLDRLGLFFPFLLSAALHEGGHLLALRLMRLPVREIRIGLTGTVIRAELPDRSSALLCLLAGPAVNLLLALLFRRSAPALCLCSTFLFLYNMLPVCPLDGGGICRLLLPHWLCLCLQYAVILSAVVFGAWGSFILRMGLLPCLCAAFFLLRLPKTSCKTERRLLE